MAVQSQCTDAIQKYYEDLPMNNCKETVGYFVAKIRDLESAESASKSRTPDEKPCMTCIACINHLFSMHNGRPALCELH